MKKMQVDAWEKNRPIDPSLEKIICRTVGQVAQVFGKAATTIIDLRNGYRDFPIQPGNREFSVPASEFDAWFRKHPEALRRPER